MATYTQKPLHWIQIWDARGEEQKFISQLLASLLCVPRCRCSARWGTPDPSNSPFKCCRRRRVSRPLANDSRFSRRCRHTAACRVQTPLVLLRSPTQRHSQVTFPGRHAPFGGWQTIMIISSTGVCTCVCTSGNRIPPQTWHFHTCAQRHTHTHTLISTHTFTNTHMHTTIHTYIHTHMYIFHAYIHTYIHTCMHACMPTHIHTSITAGFWPTCC